MRARRFGARERVARLGWRPDDDVDTDIRSLRALLVELSASPPRRVGLASAPVLDRHGVVRDWPNRPAWTGIPLAGLIAEVTRAPVTFADDGALAALAEATAGACEYVVYLGLGTGVGGGVVVDGRLLRSATNVGHLVLDPGGPRCVCGLRGCLQSIASAPAAAAHATRLRGTPTTSADLADAVNQSRPWALRVLTTVARAVAQATILLSDPVRPVRLYVGGGFGAALPILPELVASSATTLAPAGSAPLAASGAIFGANSSLAGARLLAARPALLDDAGIPGGHVPMPSGAT